MRLLTPLLGALASQTCSLCLCQNNGQQNSSSVGHHQSLARQGGDKNSHRVLIVGAGLTGCLTAAFLRRLWAEKKNEDHLHISIMERATYPAGRFGAAARRGGQWAADMGAQVLSVVDPDEEHEHVLEGGTRKP